MLKIKSNATPSKVGLLPAGDHIVKVDSISECFNKDHSAMPWDDKTPQIAIKFKNNKGYITHWINLKGYMVDEDYGNIDSAERSGIIFKPHPFSKIKFAVDLQTNCRIENEAKTVTCLHILGRIASCCGVPAGEEIELHKLIGAELLIRVSVISGQLKVTHTYKNIKP